MANQERYHAKLADIHKTNAKFMAYAEQKDPAFVAGFFAEKSVILLFLIAFLNTYINLFSFSNLIQQQQHQRHQQYLQRQAEKEEYNRCVFLHENQVVNKKHTLFTRHLQTTVLYF